MNEVMLAYCGLECKTCMIHLATLEQDASVKTKMRVEIAAQISKIYGTIIGAKEITDCDGCKTGEGRLFKGCYNCEVRKCAAGRNMIHCAYCCDYACDKLKSHFAVDPGALERLEAIRLKKQS